MQDTVNVIIPAVKLNDELLKCLKEINKINYSKFITTIVLDSDSNRKLPRLKYKLKKLVVGKINMSKKRNIAAKKFKSKYIAFIDSDAYPNKNWLKFAVKYLKKGMGDVIGGPGISFPNENYKEKICYLSKRSYFVSGYLNFRKYKTKKRYCDWLEACNLIMERKFFLKYKGMDEKKYTGEDKEFFERVRKKKPDLKVFYSPDLFIYHKERRMFGFFLQRFVFGVDFINLIKFNSGLKGFQPILPIVILISFFLFLISNIEFNLKILILTAFASLINFLILLDIKKYIKSLETLIFTLVTINIANIAFALGSISSLFFFGFKKIFVKKIYLYSRNKKVLPSYK